jgi:3-methylcrotonyl-CoA carboxylase alpha subunit
VETGVEDGDTVSPFYDPMIAKLVVHEADREAAIDAMLTALNASYVSPLQTNQGFLYECLALDEFRTAQLETGLIARKGNDLLPAERPSSEAIDAAARRYRRDYLDWIGFRPNDLRAGLFGFRLNSEARSKISLHHHGTASVGETADFQRSYGISTTMTPENVIFVTERGQTYTFTVRGPDSSGHGSVADGAILAPMPGKVIAVDVAEGQEVAAGERLMVLEAMKMEHALTAPFDGTVAELKVSAGSQVQVETLLARVEKAAE